jgi:Carboxypeptidase regulatory-like domain/TonB dependent receptor
MHSRRHKVRRAPVAVVFLSLFGGMLCAQSTDASLSGRVADPSKARIAGAKLEVVQSATNARYGTTTNAAGEYDFPNLPPGDYRVEIEAPGFKRLIDPAVALHVQDARNVDFEMAIGSASESITVQGGAAPIDTESATVSTVVDQDFVDNLPMNGRSFQTLIMLTPGVVVTGTAFDDQGQFSVNGQRGDANYFTVDGVSANFGVTGYLALVQGGTGALPALTASGGTNSLVSLDAMQEFRVQTSSFAPEFGRTPGGQISIVTRAGTNSFHGTLFDYFRNDALDANNWFSGFDHLRKPEERQNDFGGVIGGPVIKDKTFFFFSYEGLRLRQPSTQETAVPDSASRQQAPAAMQPYLSAYPVANGPELGAGTAQLNASYSNPATLNASSIRIDHVLTPKLNLFGRYNYAPSSSDTRASTQGYEPNLAVVGALSNSIQTFTVGLGALINPQISNDFRANYSNNRFTTAYAMDNFGGAVPLADSVLFPSGFSSTNGFFTDETLGVGELIQGKLGTDEQRQLNFIDNFSVTKGKHQLKFGADYRWLSPFTSPFAYRQFALFLGVASCAEPCTESHGYALSGITAEAASFAQQPDALLARNVSFYGQDTWKISSRLTLTYGLRWDINPALKGKNAANDPYTVTGLNDAANLALAPRGTPLYQTTYGNVAPRVGMAYQIAGGANWTSVLRGGFGTFYDLGSGSLGGVSSYFPYSADAIYFDVPFPLSSLEAAPPALSTSPPVSTILVAEPDLKLPRTYEWNAALEQSLGSSQSLSATYVGAVGRDLLRVTDLISPNSNFDFVNVTSNSATSNYNALQLKFERRLWQGLQALASYSWSHSIDIASTDAFANYLNTPSSVANPNIDRGNSDFDIRNSFTAGVTYNLPTPESNEFAHATLGGWSVDSFIFARTAPPVDLIGGIVEADGIALYPRPDVVPGVPHVLYGSQYPGGKAFNKAAFKAPPTGQQGDFGRNVLRGFGARQADVAFQRQFDFTEKVGLRFRSEFFNLFNHPNFGQSTNSLTSALFGQSTQTLASSLAGADNAGFNPLYQIGGPRSIQLAMKLQF